MITWAAEVLRTLKEIRAALRVLALLQLASRDSIPEMERTRLNQLVNEELSQKP